MQVITLKEHPDYLAEPFVTSKNSGLVPTPSWFMRIA